jgi:hypothetical protein
MLGQTYITGSQLERTPHLHLSRRLLIYYRHQFLEQGGLFGSHIFGKRNTEQLTLL